jgi:WD40 repeat protein
LLLSFGDRFGGLYVVEAETGANFAKLAGHEKPITSLAWRSDSNMLASAGDDGLIKLWDMHALAEAAKWQAHETGVLSLDWHPTGPLASGARDGSVKVWSDKGTPVTDFGRMGDSALKVAFSPSAADLIIGDWSGLIEIRSLSSQNVRQVAMAMQPRSSTSDQLLKIPAPPLAKTEITVAASTETTTGSPSDFDRLKSALASLERAADQLKEEAARSPSNASLTKAYLQVCESIIAVKSEVLKAEVSPPSPADPPTSSP